MKRLTIMMLAMFITIIGMAQTQDDVTLTVTGDGATIEEATNNALRSAIAQTYGVFVSANTQILNDELVKDEIATVTSGNIKQYKEITSLDMPNGRKEVTVQATVSISKLISYSQSKGASAEFAGATFARNMKIRELNKSNEKKVLISFFHKMKKLLPMCYERILTVSEPSLAENGDVAIPMRIEYKPNNNLETFINSFEKTLQALSLNKAESQEYLNLGMEISELNVCSNPKKSLFSKEVDLNTSGTNWLRCRYPMPMVLDSAISSYFTTFALKDNIGQTSEFAGIAIQSDQNCFYYDTEWPDHLCSPYKATGLFGIMKEYSFDRSGYSPTKLVIHGLPFVFSRFIGLESKGKNLVDSWWDEIEWGNNNITIDFTIFVPSQKIGKYSKFELVEQ